MSSLSWIRLASTSAQPAPARPEKTDTRGEVLARRVDGHARARPGGHGPPRRRRVGDDDVADLHVVLVRPVEATGQRLGPGELLWRDAIGRRYQPAGPDADAGDHHPFTEAAVDAITRSDGHINLLINNAGIATPNLGPHASRPTPKWDIARVRDYWFAKSFEDYAAVLETNTTAALQSTFAFLGLLDAGNKVRAEREMEKKKREEAAGGSGGGGGGGSPPSYVRSQVITMSSVGGFGRNNSAFIYGASKAGVTHMMKNLATYLVPRKMRVNVVAPGCKCSPSIGSLMKPP